MDYIKKLHTLCFSKEELEVMYYDMGKRVILDEINLGKYNDVFNLSEEEMHAIADSARKNFIKKKENIEIFFALFCYLDIFYPKDSQVCFELKNGIDIKKVLIDTLDDLKKITKEETNVDFSIMSDDGLRQFQLKQYKDRLTTEALFDFVRDKLAHYGNNLGTSNLLIVLQSPDTTIDSVDFALLSEMVKTIDVKTDIEVLITYNENDEFEVVNRVYPELGTARKPRPRFL